MDSRERDSATQRGKGRPGRWLTALMLVGAAALLPATALADGPDAGSGWPQLKRDGPKTGIATANGPVLPSVAWSYNAGSAIVSGPILANDGTVYIGTENYRVLAVNQGGSRKWEYVPPDSGGSQPPTYLFVNSKSRVVLGTQNGYVIGLQTDGKEDWKFDTRNAPYGSSEPQAVRSPIGGASNYGRVLVGTDKGLLYELEDGAFAGVRRSEADGAIKAGAAVAPDGTLIWAANRAIRAGTATGGDKWRIVLDGSISSTPAVGGDSTVYVATENGSVYAVGTDGIQRWQARPGDARRYRAGLAVGTDGTVYAAGDEGRLFALDPATGATKWSFGTGGQITSSPAVGANGLIYLASGDSKLYILGQNGAQLGMFQGDAPFEISSPAIGKDGTLYVGSRAGTLYALRGEFTPPAATPTPAPAGPATGPSTAAAPSGFSFIRCGSGKVYTLNGDGTIGTLLTSPSQLGSNAVILQTSDQVPQALIDAVCGPGK